MMECLGKRRNCVIEGMQVDGHRRPGLKTRRMRSGLQNKLQAKNCGIRFSSKEKHVNVKGTFSFWPDGFGDRCVERRNASGTRDDAFPSRTDASAPPSVSLSLSQFAHFAGQRCPLAVLFTYTCVQRTGDTDATRYVYLSLQHNTPTWSVQLITCY